MTEQPGDLKPVPFSYINDEVDDINVSCWLVYTNPELHKLVAENIEKTAPYGGYTTGTGTRYCLSIEDKVSRFPDRNRHQIFLEPEGLDTEEVYIQGMSTSLPEELQEQMYKMIPGLENAVIAKYAYSIEYECLDPLVLTPSLAYMDIDGLFCAGQINGTSGYEEAAAQGLIAGINAARSLDSQEPFILSRSEAYIGVLIDDLVTKGTNEPYRIMTSRAEFRLFLRQDNADLRLTEKGYEIGLASKERYERYLKKKQEKENEINRLKNTKVSMKKANVLLEKLGSSPVSGSVTLAELLTRPEVNIDALAEVCEETEEISRAAKEQAEIEIKYRGYIEKQLQQTSKFEKMEKKRLPEKLNYAELDGLRLEARQKLSQIKPVNLGQAARISGVSPADVSVLMIHLTKNDKHR
jgi:tRNA uridine 5-carboxymethylaminomethyl modification enzyme